MLSWLKEANRLSPWHEARVCVAGTGRAGFAAADALVELDAHVVVIDDDGSEQNRQKARLLEVLGAECHIGPGSSETLPDVDLLIVSPGWHPDSPMIVKARNAGIEIWGDVELSWRLMYPDRIVPWLGITGTNGKTTTAQMTVAILEAAGIKSCAVGNIGRPILEAMQDDIDYEVYVVELSSFQLHWTKSLSLHSAAVLNVEEDHLEWYAHDEMGRDPMEAYAADKASIYHRVVHSCVYNADAVITEKMVEQADVVEGARAIGFTTNIPQMSMIGVVDDLIVDRAFVAQRKDSALPLVSISDIEPAARHVCQNAMAAACLARSYGVSPAAVAEGLRSYRVDEHRISTVAIHDGIRWVDDSKATNPHAAQASLSAYESIVWIAGGQAKGTDIFPVVKECGKRLKAVILLGKDREVYAESIRTHLPDLPIAIIDTPSREAMGEAVQAAAHYAQSGDTVLLAPGCASKDMWSGYDQRGEDFIAAVQTLIGHDDESQC